MRPDPGLAAQPKGLHRQLYVQVLVGLAAGVLVGYLWPALGVRLKPLEDGFVKLIKMMIGPVVFCTIAGGVTALGDRKGIGRTLARAIGFFCALTIAGMLVGLAAVELFQPGRGMNIDPATLDPSVAAQYGKRVESLAFVDFVLNIIPGSFFGALAEGEVLPVLLVAILVGFGLMSVGQRGEPLVKAIESLKSVLFVIFGLLLRLAPLGAFGAMAFTVARHGIRSISSLGLLIATFYGAGAFFVFVVMGLLARAHGFGLWSLLRYLREEILIVLGTSSSEPVLPRLLVRLEALGCNKGVVGLVLPAGYSFNLVGTAIYLPLAAVFIAQATNVHLSATRVLGMLVVMFITSKGAAGVSGSGFVALVATLTVIPEIPVAGVAILVGIDRFMSEARALTSVVTNAVSVVIVSIWAKACDREVLRRELARGPAEGELRAAEGEASPGATELQEP